MATAKDVPEFHEAFKKAFEAGLTEEEIAKACHTSRTMPRVWSRGYNTPPIESFRRELQRKVEKLIAQKQSGSSGVND